MKAGGGGRLSFKTPGRVQPTTCGLDRASVGWLRNGPANPGKKGGKRGRGKLEENIALPHPLTPSKEAITSKKEIGICRSWHPSGKGMKVSWKQSLTGRRKPVRTMSSQKKDKPGGEVVFICK